MKATYTARIGELLGKLETTMASPDAKNNTGRLLGMAFFWDAMYKYAGGRSDDCWSKIEKEHFIDKKKLSEGEHELGESPHFKIKAKVSKPYVRFDDSKFAGEAAKAFKVPVHKVVELMEACKVPTTSRVTLSIEERVS